MTRRYTAMMQFRTSMSQGGRVAGYAGELEVSEAEVLRQLLEIAFDQPGLTAELGRRIRDEAKAEREAAERFEGMSAEDRAEAIRDAEGGSS